MNDLCLLLVCGAPLAVRAGDIFDQLVKAGWRVNVLMTPSALAWPAAGPSPMTADHQLDRIDVTRSESPAREMPAVVIVAPITFNTVGKVAAGIADTRAHSALCEAVGARIPILAVPMVNTRLWGHPAWSSSVRQLTTAGITWMSVEDGTLGDPEPLESGSGYELAARFDPEWIVGWLPVVERTS